ncbi:MAG: DNA-protecting protein DprA [Proteobacteria bacterium]|nr:DNA-protecting protein DprA [Pseudomonadota bacterium]
MTIRDSLKIALKWLDSDRFSEEKIDRILNWCEKNQTLILFRENLPPLLKQIPLTPQVLFIKGSLETLFSPLIGIVGARKASSYGLACAFKFARQISACGVGVVSGLARGVDGVAHQGALTGGGKTIAVLGSGFTHIYPREHQWLAAQILEKGGTWVSEYPPFTPPLAHHFPHRNRIISGMSLGTLVVEAKKKSGSLITALSGLNQGREVFVVPGPIDDERFQGGHELIQQGAKLVTELKDVVDELPLLLSAEKFQRLGGKNPFKFAESFTLADWLEGAENNELRDLQHLISQGQIIEIAPQRYLSIGNV